MAVGRYCGDGVAVAHPYLRVLFEAFKQSIVGIECPQVGTSILACAGLFNLSAVRVGNKLRSIADAEHRIFAYKLTEVYLESLSIMNRIRRSAQNHTDNVAVVFRKLVVRQDFAKRVELTHSTAYQLCGL